MNRLAAAGRIAVCLAFSIGLSAQTPTITVTPTGTAGVYTLTGQYTAQAQVHPPTGNVAFEDTTYSNAVLASAPFSSSVTSSIVPNGSQSFTSLYGYYYSNVFVRDFDGDSKPDLLFIGLDQYLHFFKGNGDGTFQTGITDSSVTMQTTLLSVGDWDGDGKLDIAASSGALVDTNSGPANATTLIRRANGDGTFQAPTQFTETIPQSCHQVSLQSGDFNGDGKPDLFSNLGCYPSHLYLGNGDGTFAVAVDNTSASGPIADFNNDGRADIYSDHSTMLGASNGLFQSVSHTSGPIGAQVIAADFNHDGKLDVAGFTDGNAIVCLGNGDGTFQAASTYNIDPTPVINPYNQYDYQYIYWSTAGGDFNGDGVPDVVFLGSYTTPSTIYFPFNVVAVLFGRPDGSFSSPQIFTDTSFVFSNTPNFLSVDLTGSGPDTLLQFYIDYTGSDYSTPTPAVHRYTATNTYTATATDVIVSPGGTHQVRAHFAGDANYGAATSTTQAVTGSTSQATLSLAISPNPSTYGARADMTVTVTPCTVGSYSCDADWVTIYDGSTAVTSGHPSGGVAHVIWRNFSQGTHVITAKMVGNTNLSSATSNAVTLTVGPPLGIVSTLTLANPQQVGSTYTLTAQLSTPALEVAPTGSVSFVDLTANNSSLATATFAPPRPVLQSTNYTSMSHLSSALYAADFDNDAKTDLIYPVNGTSVGFLRGNGNGSFSATPTATAPQSSAAFAIADFNHDGKLDVVLAAATGVSLLRGNGDGTFATATTIASGPTSYSTIFAGDFNGDGKQDFYIHDSLFLGNGDGTFQSPIAVANSYSTQLVADFNQDGRTDLFTYGTLYLGQADGTFTAVPAPTYYASLVADFNNDGKPDLLTVGGGGYSTTTAVVLSNGDGTFQAPLPVDLSDPNGYSSGIYFTGDFNGDGKADLGAVTLYASGGYHTSGQYFLNVTFGDGTGAFTNKTATSGELNDSQQPSLAVPTYLPDFNGDAASDIPIYTQAYRGTPDAGIGIALYTTPSVYTATATGITVNGPPYGSHSVQAIYPGDTNYLDEASNIVQIVAPIPVTVMLAVSRNPINTGQQVTFTATLSPFSDGNWTTNGGTIYFSEGSTLLGSGVLNNGVAQFTTSSLSAGSHSIIAQYPGYSIFASATSVPLSMQVGPTAVNITWPPPAAITYGTALSSTQLNASTAIAGSFAYSPVAGTVLASGTQTLSATFTPTDTVTYSTTTATVTLVVNKATPSIAVTQTSPTTTGTNVGTATTLLATLSAGYGTPTGTVTFYDGSTSIGSGTLSGNTVSITSTFTTAGTHTITAVYAGNTNFNTVTSASFGEVVSKITPTITWPTPTAITYGTALSTAQLNATSSVAGTFVYSPAAGVVLPGGSQTLSVAFTPTDTNTYSNATATVTLVVNKATPSITWATPAAISYGTALSATQLNATGTAAGTFVYSPVAGTVLGVGSQTLSVTFTPTDTTSYNSATATTSLVVDKATPSITWAAPAAITYGTALSATQLNATSSVAGSFVYSPAAGTVLGTGTQTLSVTFTPTDTTSYNSATTTTTLVISKTTPSITWATPAAITYGTALSATQLNASSSVAGTFTYSPAAGTIPGAGSQALSTTLTPTDTANYSSANGSTTLVVNKATPSITVSQTSPITIGVGTGVATTFRAALAASYGTPTGTVGFYEGTTLLGSAPLISGAASVTTTFSTTGVHTITALYTGDANFNTVTSAAFNETVVLFGIGLAANPTTLTIKQGQSGTATITATPTGNYTGTLTFSCGSLPSSVSCSFAPATLTFNGDNQPQTTTITVSTRTTSAALMSTSNMRLASILALPLLAFGLRRRRMLQRGLLVLFAAMLLLPTSGCGGNPTTTTSNPPTTGQQTVTINAQTTANGGSTQSFNFSIVIEP